MPVVGDQHRGLLHLLLGHMSLFEKNQFPGVNKSGALDLHLHKIDARAHQTTRRRPTIPFDRVDTATDRPIQKRLHQPPLNIVDRHLHRMLLSDGRILV